jgi:hypothetical protein
MRIQLNYRVTLDYRPDPEWAPGDVRRRVATVRASSDQRAADALLRKIRETHRNADMIEFKAV